MYDVNIHFYIDLRWSIHSNIEEKMNKKLPSKMFQLSHCSIRTCHPDKRVANKEKTEEPESHAWRKGETYARLK